MNKAKNQNIESFDSASHLFNELSDSEAAHVSGGFIWETNLSSQQAQGFLGNSYNGQENYSLVVFDTNENNEVSPGDDYFIYSYSDIYFENGSIGFNSQQASQLGIGDGSNPSLSVTVNLDINGRVGYSRSVSPRRAPRSSGPI